MLYRIRLKTKGRQGYFTISRKEKETIRRRQAISTKGTALFGLLIALAFVLGYVEPLIPVYLETPEVKLGLVNLVTMTTLCCMGVRAAIAANAIRTLLSGFTFGSTSVILFSLAGATFSLTVMTMCKKFHLFGMMGASMLGGVIHNIGQFLMAAFVVYISGVFSYLPVLPAAGTVTSVLIRLPRGMVVQRISHVIREI